MVKLRISVMSITTRLSPLLRLLLSMCFALPAAAMTPQDVALTRSVAKHGNASAQVLLAVAYLHGDGGLAADVRLAAHWFEQAALQGNVYAERHLGNLYEEGLGVPRNPVVARDWYECAARRGDPDAELMIGTGSPRFASPDYPPAEALWHLVESFGSTFHSLDRRLSPTTLRRLAEDGDIEAAAYLAAHAGHSIGEHP
jgi:hypothetical protein